MHLLISPHLHLVRHAPLFPIYSWDSVQSVPDGTCCFSKSVQPVIAVCPSQPLALLQSLSAPVLFPSPDFPLSAVLVTLSLPVCVPLLVLDLPDLDLCLLTDSAFGRPCSVPPPYCFPASTFACPWTPPKPRLCVLCAVCLGSVLLKTLELICGLRLVPVLCPDRTIWPLWNQQTQPTHTRRQFVFKGSAWASKRRRSQPSLGPWRP